MNRVKIETEYLPLILREYDYWTLMLNEKQRYLGRAVVWLMRPGEMQRFSDLSITELIELKSICKIYETALFEIGWKPDHINYFMLGNYVHEHSGHGHMHLIPRYKTEHTIEMLGYTFHDDRWGKNYTPETPLTLPRNTVLSIANAIKEQLP